jgi:hypothetical protein
MKFYVNSTRYGYKATNIMARYPHISHCWEEEIVEEVCNTKIIRHRLAVNLDTAADVLRFTTEVDNDIIVQNFENPEIEIYDDYRE